MTEPTTTTQTPPALDLTGLAETARTTTAHPLFGDDPCVRRDDAPCSCTEDSRCELHALRAELTALRERVSEGERETELWKARWQYVRRFLTVERDLTDHVEYLYWGETEGVQAPIGDHTVESLVDLAIHAARPSTETGR